MTKVIITEAVINFLFAIKQIDLLRI